LVSDPLRLTPYGLRLRVNAMHHAFSRDTIHAFVLGFMIRNGLFVFRCLTPYALRLTVKKVRVDEISESEK
jgi:hypothetical protein